MSGNAASTPILVAAEGGDRCTCRWPDEPCLRRILGNGPPFPTEPCEPAITLAEHHARRKEED